MLRRLCKKTDLGLPLLTLGANSSASGDMNSQPFHLYTKYIHKICFPYAFYAKAVCFSIARLMSLRFADFNGCCAPCCNKIKRQLTAFTMPGDTIYMQYVYLEFTLSVMQMFFNKASQNNPDLPEII